jgi:hypothetical protein
LRISIITGDSLIERIGDNEFRLFNMRRYVVKRDASGKILDIVIKENIDYDAVPDDIRSKITEENKDQPVELYTRAELVEGIYKVSQEINDEIVAGSEKDLKVLSDRFISLRWNRVDGEDYGRSYAEEFLGTIIALEKQLKVLNESAVIASKTVFTVNPNGMTKYSDFLDAANGDVIIGSETDIGTIKSNKHVDLQITHALVNEYKQELAQAFLMGSSAIRDAERVTAREVQMVATELESSFGGIYTAIAEDIQIPLVESAMKSLKIEAGKDIDIIITAGVEALGRNIEMSKINNLLNELGMLAQLVGPDEIKKVINVSSVTSSMVANSGVAGKNFLYTSSELAANDKAAKQEAMTQQMLQGGLPTAGQAMAGSAVQQMNQGA